MGPTPRQPSFPGGPCKAAHLRFCSTLNGIHQTSLVLRSFYLQSGCRLRSRELSVVTPQGLHGAGGGVRQARGCDSCLSQNPPHQILHQYPLNRLRELTFKMLERTTFLCTPIFKIYFSSHPKQVSVLAILTDVNRKKRTQPPQLGLWS